MILWYPIVGFKWLHTRCALHPLLSHHIYSDTEVLVFMIPALNFAKWGIGTIMTLTLFNMSIQYLQSGKIPLVLLKVLKWTTRYCISLIFCSLERKYVDKKQVVKMVFTNFYLLSYSEKTWCPHTWTSHILTVIIRKQQSIIKTD